MKALKLLKGISPGLSPVIEDRYKGANDIGLGAKSSQVGDSGYLSQPSALGQPATLHNTPSVNASEVTNSHMVMRF